MSPVKMKESLELLASLGDVLPFLAPAKATILLIARAVEEAEDNSNQCMYLLQRCTNLCIHINRLCKENKDLEHSEHLTDLKHALNKVLICIEHLSRKTPLQRFLQRQEISSSIENVHKCLDGCLELFHIKGIASLAFVTSRHEAARQQDQIHLASTLEQLQKNDENILESLELRGDQLMEAIRGLRNTLQRGITDAVQRQFAATSLQTLLERQPSDYPSVISYDWAVSSLEILIEGEILGSGTFGTVYAGRWNGTRVAVKQLIRGTPRQVLIKEIDIWRRLQHPHVASFFRACIESNPPLLVSELYEFGNLLVYLNDFPNASRTNICHEICLGMIFLHNQRIIHGDLKPANVLMDSAHRARITDFGLSKIKSALTTQTVGDISEAILPKSPGTKVFMAPERLRRGTMNFATDVYAFAMTAYQVFTGEAPFQHLPEDDIRQVVVVDRERPERPEGAEFVVRGLTDSMWHLIECCWADNRSERPKFEEVAKVIDPWTTRVTSKFPEIQGNNPQLSSPVKNQLSVESSVTVSAVLDQDSGSPRRIPGTDLVISANDFQASHAPGFSAPSSAGPSAELAELTFSKPFDDITVSTLSATLQLPTEAPDAENSLLETSKPPRWHKRLSRTLSGSSPPGSPKDTRHSIVSRWTKKDTKGKNIEKNTKNKKDTKQTIKKAGKKKEDKTKLDVAKIVIVGDGACGKTSLLVKFASGDFPKQFEPTIFENYVADVSIFGRSMRMALWDTAGQEDYDKLRPLSYSGADALLICFSIETRDTLPNVKYKWLEEAREHLPEVPFVLVGCKKDLRTESRRPPVTTEEGEALAESIGAYSYVECSALTGEGVMEVFRTATTCALGILIKKKEVKDVQKGCIIA